MKVLKIQQNSEEWAEFRKGKSGGSEFKDLWIAGLPLKSKMVEYLERDGQKLPPEDKKTVASVASLLEPEELAEMKLDGEPKKRFYEIIAERVARPITPNDYIEELNGEPFTMMARGHILEPQAIAAFEEKTGKVVDKDSVVWISDFDEDSYISPDGVITGEDGKAREAVEVKCLSSAEVVKAYLEGHYPKEYEPQVIKYFVVNEDLETLHFVMYTDVIPGLEIQIFDIKREEVADRLEEAKAFEKVILKRIAKAVDKIEGLSF
ncbi:YqaJ viral recombinase family protein [Candidatus Saccharibacteria bacterium]|nr:YqaJ viral recombinase family protein [Candidatus Saccharibacteria bacterium]MBR3180680.1 YqaJ viral recombinase family protein [Candidatus Saccharibacteria bacterium]